MTSKSAGLSLGPGYLCRDRFSIPASVQDCICKYSPLSSLQFQTPATQPSRLTHSTSMLCQRCATFLRGSRLAGLPKHTTRQASSSALSRRLGHPSTSTAPWAPQSIPRYPTAAPPAITLRPYSSSAPPDTSATAAEAPNPSSTLEKPDFLNEAESEVWDRLAKEFSPVELVVQDISGGCGSMYGIEISSEKFRGTNMLKQQRMVNAVLSDLMKTWHGVQLKTRVP